MKNKKEIHLPWRTGNLIGYSIFYPDRQKEITVWIGSANDWRFFCSKSDMFNAMKEQRKIQISQQEFQLLLIDKSNNITISDTKTEYRLYQENATDFNNLFKFLNLKVNYKN